LNPGKVDTLVATDLAAREVDVNGISHEINFDPPQDSATYVDRLGRAGRNASESPSSHPTSAAT
jgi:ATP-dependent RNA helicase DeaD